MNNNYVYIDKYGVLHGVYREEDAKKFSGNGKYQSYTGEVRGGYPIIEGKEVMAKVASDGYMEIGLVGKSGKVLGAGEEITAKITELIKGLM